MSDKATSDAGASNGSAVGPTFSEREQEIMRHAWRSLKSGPPEIDYEKLAGFVGMSNPRSASNAWAKIKIKLLADNPEGAATPAKPKTPRKKAGGKKDLSDGDGAGIADGEDNVPETPKKTPRKRAPKKQDVDGEESPKKKGRTAPKTPNKKKSEPTVFSDDEAEDDGKVEALAKVKLEEETEKDEGKDAMDETPDEV